MDVISLLIHFFKILVLAKPLWLISFDEMSIIGYRCIVQGIRYRIPGVNEPAVGMPEHEKAVVKKKGPKLVSGRVAVRYRRDACQADKLVENQMHDDWRRRNRRRPGVRALTRMAKGRVRRTTRKGQSRHQHRCENGGHNPTQLRAQKPAQKQHADTESRNAKLRLLVEPVELEVDEQGQDPAVTMMRAHCPPSVMTTPQSRPSAIRPPRTSQTSSSGKAVIVVVDEAYKRCREDQWRSQKVVDQITV